MYVDFIGLAMEPIVNQAAKLRYMFGGKAKVPMVIRAQEGAGRGNAAQHSQSLEAWFCHIPGLKVVTPSHARRCQGPAEVRHPRRQPGHLPRAQGPVLLERATCPRRST